MIRRMISLALFAGLVVCQLGCQSTSASTSTWRWSKDRKVNYSAKGGRDSLDVPEQADRLMMSFRDTLASGDFGAALTLCSDRVHQGRKSYGTDAKFMNSVLPVKEIVDLDHTPIFGMTENMEEPIEIHCFASLAEMQWKWSVKKVADRWEIDFNPVSLKALSEEPAFLPFT